MHLQLVLCAAAFLTFCRAAAPATIEVKLDINHSTVGFGVPILGGLSVVRGKFTDVQVTVTRGESDVLESSVRAVIQAKSIDTGIDARDEHLRSEDFFDVEKFPTITFTSSRLEKRDGLFVAIGELELHGVNKAFELPFEISGRSVSEHDGKKLANEGYRVRTKLDRRDFGIDWKHDIDPNFVGNEISIEFDLITKAFESR